MASFAEIEQTLLAAKKKREEETAVQAAAKKALLQTAKETAAAAAAAGPSCSGNVLALPPTPQAAPQAAPAAAAGPAASEETRARTPEEDQVIKEVERIKAEKQEVNEHSIHGYKITYKPARKADESTGQTKHQESLYIKLNTAGSARSLSELKRKMGLCVATEQVGATPAGGASSSSVSGASTMSAVHVVGDGESKKAKLVPTVASQAAKRPKMEEAEGEALAPASNPPGIDWSWLEAIPPHSDKSYSLKSLCQQNGLDDTGLAKKLVARLIEAPGGPSAESLRKMCMAAGLGTSGGRKELADRLEKQQHAFLNAAKRGDFEEVRKLLEVHSHLVNVQPKGRWSALHQFAQKGDKDAVEYLREKGAGTCVVNKYAATPEDVTPLNAPAVRSMLQDKENKTLSAISKVIQSQVHHLDDHRTKNTIRMDLQDKGYVEGTHYCRQWFKGQIDQMRERTDSLDILNFKQAAKEADVQLDGSETKEKIIEKLAVMLAAQGEVEEAKSAVPWNLHGFKKRSLEKLGAARLKLLCWERDLDVKKKAHSTTCIQRLMEWKKKPTPEPTITEESMSAEEPMAEESDAGDGGEEDDDGEDAAIQLPDELRDNPGLVRVHKPTLQGYGKEILRKLCFDRRIPGIRKNCSNVQKMADALARWRGTPKAKQWVEALASEDDDEEEEEEDKPMDIPEDEGFAVSDKVYIEGESRLAEIKEIRDGQVLVRIPFRPSQWVDVEKVSAAKQKGNREAVCEPSAKKKKMAPEQSASSSSAFGAKTKEAENYSALTTENREKIMKMVEDYLKMQRLEEENKQLQEDVGNAKELLRKAGAQIMKLEAQLSDGIGLLTKKQSKQLKDDKRIPTGYMEIKTYRKALEERGLLEKAAGAAHEGQHVFHIIAAANGGPDHTDNYLFALGGTFNIAVGAHLDHFNCFLAGKAKAIKAVAIAEKTAKDPELHKWIRTPTGKDFRLYTEGKHKGKTGEDLFNDGQKVFRAIRDEERDSKKAKGSSST